MAQQQYDLGMVGLGVMGRNLLLNMADHGFSVVGFDQNPDPRQRLQSEAHSDKVAAVDSLAALASSLKTPRAVMMLVPAGSAVDAVIAGLLDHLSAGDIIIDGGNSFFEDTNLRAKKLAEHDIAYLGVGISGGESGARHGPSIMPGGHRDAYQRVRPILEAVAAKVNGEPCVTYLGPGAAGHFVKMVHNGIEYGIMQILAESYDLLHRGLGFSDDRLHAIYDEWNKSDELNGFLLEITANIFAERDEQTGKRLVDVIEDAAKQKGTGMWTSQEAMNLHTATPTIDIAVSMRDMSALKDEREAACDVLGQTPQGGEQVEDHDRLLQQLRDAVYASMIVTYAQGMALLSAASREYGYGLRLSDVARIWRGGCIIRSAFLEDIRAAYDENPGLPNLMVAGGVCDRLLKLQDGWRGAVRICAALGIPAPALMVSLGYFDSYRSARLPANLIQAQRDFFGSHTYERIDRKGIFHTLWSAEGARSADGEEVTHHEKRMDVHGS